MTVSTLRRAALVLAVGAFASLPVLAKAPGTLADAKGIAEQAIGHVKKVGFDQAMKDFTADQATWGIASREKVFYVTAYAVDGTVLAHSVNNALPGRNLIAIKDQNGKEVIKDAGELAKKGGGKYTWMWAHPVTKKMANAEGFVIPVPGKDAYVWGVAFVD